MVFYNNPARDEEFYVELDDDLNINLRFKWNKCTFLLRVLTQRELETCQHFYMTSDHNWYPGFIYLNKIIKISQVRSIKHFFLRVQQDTVYISPSLDIVEGVYDYQDLTSDEAILSEINPSLVHIK